MRSVSFAILALAALGLAACGGGAATPTGPTVAVDMGEFKFTPDVIEIPAGQTVILELRNKGTVEHDFVIDAIGLKVIVNPARTAQRAIGPFEAGTTYAVYCAVAGHKESGMTAKLVVK